MRVALARDLRLAARSLAKRPGFTLPAVVTLALGMGATTSIFGLVNTVLLRKVPVPRPDGLVNLHAGHPERDARLGISYPNLVDIAAKSRSLAGVTGFSSGFASFRHGEREARVVETLLATGSYFEVLGVAPWRGRVFGPREDAEGAPVAVVSHRFAERELGGDAALGASIRINGSPYTVIGILPESFTGTFVGFEFSVWLPLRAGLLGDAAGVAASSSPGTAKGAGGARGHGVSGAPEQTTALSDRSIELLELIGRLRPGVSLDDARAELAALGRALVKEHPVENKGLQLVVMPTTPVDDSLRGVVTRLFALLLAGAVLVLVVAGVNVAGLLLARGAARTREIAIRQAIGAGRRQIARQLLAETLVLFALGGAAGVLLSLWLSQLLGTFAPRFGGFTVKLDLAPDLKVLGVAAATSLAAALVFGLAPALAASRTNVVDGLKEGASGRKASRARDLLVAGQIAASMLLLVVAALFGKALGRVRAADPGYAPDGLLMSRLELELATRDEAKANAIVDELLARARALPGITSAAAVRRVPLSGFGSSAVRVHVNGLTSPGGEGFEAESNTVTPGAFETLGVPLLEGRDFTVRDRADGPRVVLVNETLASRFWPGESAVGKRFRVAGASGRNAGTEVEVVGVVKAGKYRSLAEAPRLLVAFPLSQRAAPRVNVLVRTAAPRSAGVANALRALIAEVDRDLPVLETMRVTDNIGVSFLPQRIAGAVTGGLGVVGVLLAAVGLYGVVAASVARQTREIAIRMAVGARASQVAGRVLKRGALLLAAGIAAGSAGALALGRLLSSLLFGVSPADPAALALAALALATVTLAACAVPARRAARLDPAVALRAE